MWCTTCNKEVNNFEDNKCYDCGSKLQEDIPVEVYYCSECNVPIIKELNSISKLECPICGSKVKYLTKDIRPVFPEERLLVEILWNKPLKYINDSVWASANRYYINGETKLLTSNEMKKMTPEAIREKLKEFEKDNNYQSFNKFKDKFIKTNSERLNFIKNEAFDFVKNECTNYSEEQLVVSFSGGKDSTVTSDVVIKALGKPSIVHIFGDTTLEFPITAEYKDRFRKNNPLTILRTAKNKERDFYEVCEQIGPPSRVMRWCCTMFKTGPISRVMNSMFGDQNILTFYGIRKCESESRSKYERSYDSPKIRKQRVASPIFYWKDIDIWLYLLGENVDFNDAYRKGYDRVGCWCCPNNSGRSQFLNNIYMPELSKKWREYLVDFARKLGKPDAEQYVDTGKWKARQGGNGVEAAQDIKINYSNCTTEENAKIYKLNKDITDDFYQLFIPFGIVDKELGRKLINEVIVLHPQNKVPIISIQPFKSNDYEIAVKIQTMNVKKHEELQRMIGYQVRKYNACKLCLGCEAVCKYRAITVNESGYKINANRCKRCKMCVTAKYLQGGCLMVKYLVTKADT